MSRKHHCKHNRSLSNYKDRLLARGFSRTPVMPSLNSLRRKVGLPPIRIGKEDK
jgi:hypothetical protein